MTGKKSLSMVFLIKFHHLALMLLKMNCDAFHWLDNDFNDQYRDNVLTEESVM